MGRTIPSFRLALADEQVQWVDYRKHLTKHERQAFDELFSTVGLYVSACSMAAKPDRLYVIMTSILLQHYLDLVNIADTLGAIIQPENAIIESKLML